MEKFNYRLIAPGRKRKAIIGKQLRDVKWKVPYYSNNRTVYAKDEESALYEIRKKLGNKWIGFRMIKES